MNWSKNKYGIAFLVIVAVAAIHYFFFYEPCKEPSDVQVSTLGLKCAMMLLQSPVDELRAELCISKGEQPGCELTLADRPAAMELINKKALACTKALLKEENYCTDKADKLVQRMER